MARAKARQKIAAKRAESYRPKEGYSPEKKKDRRAAREKRKKKREERRAAEPPKKQKKPPRKEQPPKPQAPPPEVDYLIEQLYQKIDDIAGTQIPKYSNAVSSICSAGVSDFLQTVDRDNPDLPKALSNCLTDPILNRSFYDSEQTEEAKLWADSLRALGQHLQSKDITDLANEIADFEDTDAEEWLDFEGGSMSNSMFL